MHSFFTSRDGVSHGTVHIALDCMAIQDVRDLTVTVWVCIFFESCDFTPFGISVSKRHKNQVKLESTGNCSVLH